MQIPSRESLKYDVFISYRTSISLDRKAAEELQTILEFFPIPGELKSRIVSPTLFRNRLVVCRDVTELPAGHDLDAAIREKLERSKWLIVVCSPETKESNYCKSEITYFRSIHGASKILCLLIAGEPKHVIPPILDDGFNAELTDLAADVRDATMEGMISKLRGRGVPQPEQAKFKLLAPILGCSTPDDLLKRHTQRRRRLMFGILIFTLLIVMVVGYLLRQNYLDTLEKNALTELGAMNITVKLNENSSSYKVVVDALNETDDTKFRKITQLLSYMRKSIVSLELHSGQMTSSAAIVDAGLTELREVDLSFCRRLTKVSPLANLPNLSRLEIPGSAVNDGDVLVFAKNCPAEFEILSLSETSISDRALAAISSSLRKIDQLWLSETKITAKGIRVLSTVSIRELKLRDMPTSFLIDNEVAGALLAIDGLKILDLDGTAVTGDSLSRLQNHGVTVQGNVIHQ